ncbi:LuxR family transcriptional regulator [Eilatimonas milleporae]|uniref:LuxR family transcriptional regulator n=1 Tax=Eilatimonas milleporae TaxID=911205 RepID=A0A3M0CKX5_9PROT|nr:LuxR family transcriptional regulator [Eilatimonas milleporae]RMB07676.1 LuxR family transcriptional regulator [Eilatimonas milleporae]
MPGLELVENFITKIKTVDTVDDLRRAFASEIAQLGFGKHICISLVDMNNPPPNAIQIFDYPPAWIERYKREGYFRDDVVLKTAFSNIGPYRWSSLDRSDKRNRRIFAEAEQYGIREGMTVPVTLPGHYPCCVNMAGAHTDVDPATFHILHLLAEYYVLKIVELTGRQTQLFDPPSLTPRERECLVWMAKGKSDYEIGRILSISARTVNGYMENIRKKFNVSTRTQAVALAVSGGLVIP